VLLFFLRKFHLYELNFLIFMGRLERTVCNTFKIHGEKKMSVEKVRNKDG